MENVTGDEFRLGEVLASNSLSDQVVFGENVSDEVVLSCLQNAHGDDLRDELMLLADVALAPPCGQHASSGCECRDLHCLEVHLHDMQLKVLMNTADDLQHRLFNSQGDPEREAHAEDVQHFLFRCQPFFNLLESTARSTMFQPNSQSAVICARLLDFSQQLCDRLQQLVLTYASYSLLCLDETEPNSVSHFCIGQWQIQHLRMSAFLYCRTMPYLVRSDTGLYKRMRWNVDRLRGEEEAAETISDTEYYFLCYEDIPNTHAVADGNSHCNVLRLWSIGLWVQVEPDPNTEDIEDWILCEVSQGSYYMLLHLGSDEPSSSSATNSLQQLLLSEQTPVRSCPAGEAGVCRCMDDNLPLDTPSSMVEGSTASVPSPVETTGL